MLDRDPRSADLQALLGAYLPVEADEIEHVRRMQALLAAQRSFSRGQFEPGHFTASAFVLAPDADALLLIHHARLGRWLQPGGHVEAGDASVIAASRRELSEETGVHDASLTVPGIFDLDIHPIPAFKREPAHEHFDVRFLFTARDRNLVVSDEAHAARWVPFDEIEPGSADASVLRAVRKLQRGGFTAGHAPG